MSTQNNTSFQFQDFPLEPPVPGYYPGSIHSARFRQSSNRNHMLQVVLALEDLPPAYQLVADYFVLEGERVTPAGILFSRRRLLELYHACRLYTGEGDAIVPDQLLNARLQIRVDHEEWEGRLRLRVAGYRPIESFCDSDEPILF